MAYGEKFSLQFSDVYNNPRKLSILQKDYTGQVFPLIGTENPVVIKWHNRDDVYNPIIGSTCEINLFVTESAGGVNWDELDENWNLSEVEWNETTGTAGTNYDNWYDADEREYKVQISTGDISGSPFWDSINDQWQTSAVDWDDPTGQGFEFYWEGFIVVDNYQEAFTTTPYPIRLVASDGLGTLEGFDAPYSNVVLTSGGNIDTTDGSQSNFDGLFYYLIEILKLTDLDLDVYISNYVRGSSVEANKTLFHDIQAFEYGLLKNNFKRLNAKELLFKILEMTNSRIFQSQGRWYVVSNSNLIDERIIESQETTISTPIVENIYITTTENVATTIVLNGFDADGLSLTWSITDDVDNGSTSLVGNVVTYTPTTDYVGRDDFYFTASNGTNTSTPAYVNIKVIEAAEEQPSGSLPLVLPYNLYNFGNGLMNVYYGETINQALSRAKSKLQSNLFASTQIDYIREQVGISELIPVGVWRNYNISIGAGQLDATDEKTWRLFQVGTKSVFYVPNLYNASNNTLDPDPAFAFKLPRTPDSNNYVYPFQQGYYAFYVIPFIGNAFRYNSAKTAYSQNITGTPTLPSFSDISDFPSDFTDLGLTSTQQEYIVVVRIENDYITERYQFANQ